MEHGGDGSGSAVKRFIDMTTDFPQPKRRRLRREGDAEVVGMERTMVDDEDDDPWRGFWELLMSSSNDLERTHWNEFRTAPSLGGGQPPQSGQKPGCYWASVGQCHIPNCSGFGCLNGPGSPRDWPCRGGPLSETATGSTPHAEGDVESPRA